MVTNIDLEIEKTIRNEITKEYPQHSIRGEEEKDKICNSDYSWILDPLDGTLNYSRGIPFMVSYWFVSKINPFMVRIDCLHWKHFLRR